MKKGDCVLTTYGIGVVTNVSSDAGQQDDGDGARDSSVAMFDALLWRIPGKSMASCASACLRQDAVVRKLPAAPGMVTNISNTGMSNIETDDTDNNMTKVLLLSYSPTLDTYLAAPWASVQPPAGELIATIASPDPSEIMTVEASRVQASPCAKFYPLIQDLMMRGDKAAKTTATLVNTHSAALVEKSNEVLSNANISTDPNILQEETSKKVGEVSDQATKAIRSALGDMAKPENAASQVKEVVNMLKDEELTSLLEKGRERLRQLMTNDIPQATEKAMGDIGISFAPSGSSQMSMEAAATKTMIMSREKALEAMDELLSTHANTNVDAIRAQVEGQFSEMFDSLAAAARSDERLTSIFDTISERTSEWQEASGRVMASKSASIFFEGAQRLQARAATIFSPEQLNWARENSLKLTKEITEGDAALARLKSVELGDAVRKRLFAAIEMRSGSEGGLDGIIAGALTQIDTAADNAGEVAQSSVQMMLANLQTQASSSAQNAHETLLATLARRSQYRDLAVLKIEESFVNLESYLGEEMSAEEIANIASGEGGTAAIFDPIAKRAAKEIDKQLDVAEKNVTDPTVLSVLSNVRKIVSGDLTLNALTDEVVSILNDDSSVAVGERLLMQGERVLDVIENASKSQYLNDVMSVVERAGLTKEEVVKQLESLNMNSIVDVAESAVSDENARKEMLSKAADSALDFLLRILPSMPVPPFDGVKDGLIYHLSNLSMEGFKVKKENILVEIAGIRTTKDDDNSGEEVKVIDSEEAEKEFLEEKEKPTTKEQKALKATELLVIDVKDIAAVLDNAVWSFEQTYFPYLKGDGKAFAQLWEGSIRLQFELRKQKRMPAEGETSGADIVKDTTASEAATAATDMWEPVLCLHEHSVTIRELELKLLGEGKIVWVLNKISSMLKAPLCNFVTKSVQKTLGNGSGLLLEKLNEVLGPYWPLVMRTAGLDIDDLEEVTEKDVVRAEAAMNSNEVELVWRERLPLGMNLLMNDDSGLVKVVEFPRGSQARSVVDIIGLNGDSFKGATITAVNGVRFGIDDQEDLVDALKEPGRPKAVTFLLTDSDEAERIRQFCGGLEEERKKEAIELANNGDDEDLLDAINAVVLEDEGPIGVQFSNSPDDFCLVVEGFSKDDNGNILPAERCRRIDPGDILVSINDDVVLGENGAGRDKALSLFEAFGSLRPLKLGFAKPFVRHVVLTKEEGEEDDENKDIISQSGPKDELILEEQATEDGKKHVFIKGFQDVSGAVERSRVFLGDELVHVNADAVGPAARDLGMESLSLDEIKQSTKDSNSYPIALIFARFKAANRWYGSGSSNISNATKISVNIDEPADLGIEFDAGENHGDIIVKSFLAVKGPIQRLLLQRAKARQWEGLVLESIDGQAVPSYANAEMVLRAMQQSWDNNGKVEICFCDEKRKAWLRSFASPANMN